MKACRALPEGYGEIGQINLQDDKKTALKVNVGAGTVMILLLALGHLIVPLSDVFSLRMGAGLLRLVVVAAGYLAYAAAHELTHAAVMKAVGGTSVLFGFTGLYAYAGSREDYFDKTSYRLIALAPLFVWGIVFGVLCFLVPRDWFWVVWFLQAGNVGGAAGDVYVTVKLWKKPASILIRDTGVDMTVYDRS